MSVTFFLENRAHQLRRLCQDEPRRFELPAAASRNRLPKDLQELYKLLDRILVGVDHASEQRMQQDLTQFERMVVRLRFSSDEKVKRPAVKLIKAIFADAEYFSGLKPLPQYTDAFAYELLFPSWLNLLTAVMLPQAGSTKPRLEGSKQAPLFQFLGKQHASPDESELVAYLTFVAQRFDAPDCEELLHRFIELYGVEGNSLLSTINRIREASKDARQFAGRMQDYLTVKHSMHQWPQKSEYAIAYRRPALRVLPKPLVALLQRQESEAEQWEQYFETARRLRHLINSEQMLAPEIVGLIKKHEKLSSELLSLVIIGNDQPSFTPAEGQAVLAELIKSELNSSSEGSLLPESLSRLRKFAEVMAARMAGFSESVIGFFVKSFIKEEANRKVLLDACYSDELRGQLASHLLARAGKTDDDTRFLEWVSCASIVSSDDQAHRARLALLTLAAVVENRSIGNREFADLVADLQRNANEAITMLAAPIMAARGKGPRLGSLYMTLNEMMEADTASGRTGNFSVIRAKYSNLSNL